VSTQLLDSLPEWLLYLLLLFLFWATLELGYKLGDWRQRATEYVDEGRSAQAGIVLGALLTVASLMLAFTFSMAGGQFNARRELVIEEVNAIGTAFLRAEQLPQPQRSRSRRLWVAYVNGRDTLFKDSEPVALKKALEQQRMLWDEVLSFSPELRDPILSIYVQALNEVIDLHTKRANVQDWMRLPGMIIVVLVVLSTATMLLTGYLLGLRQNRYGLPTAVMIFIYATVYLIVIDLDRPRRGIFTINQQPMIELHTSMQSALRKEGDQGHAH
jgi:hypothetical protein